VAPPPPSRRRVLRCTPEMARGEGEQPPPPTAAPRLTDVQGGGGGARHKKPRHPPCGATAAAAVAPRSAPVGECPRRSTAAPPPPRPSHAEPVMAVRPAATFGGCIGGGRSRKGVLAAAAIKINSKGEWPRQCTRAWTVRGPIHVSMTVSLFSVTEHGSSKRTLQPGQRGATHPRSGHDHRSKGRSTANWGGVPVGACVGHMRKNTSVGQKGATRRTDRRFHHCFAVRCGSDGTQGQG